MYEVIPGILEKDWEGVEQKIRLLSPFARTLHIDVIDNKLAPNLTLLDPAPFAKYKDQFILEAHLMVEEPINYLKAFADAGFVRFIGHVEKMSDQVEFVGEAQVFGEVGLAIDGPTPLNAITVPFDEIDSVLVMTIKAGFSGQSFMPEHLEKVKAIRQKGLLNGEGSLFPIEVDGGIKDTTIVEAKEAGATRFITTSFLYTATDPHVQYMALQSLFQ